MEPPSEPPTGPRPLPRKRRRDAENTQPVLLAGQESSPDSVGNNIELGLRTLNLIDLVGKSESESRKDDEAELGRQVDKEVHVLDLIGQVGEDRKGKGVMEAEEVEQGRVEEEGRTLDLIGRVGEDTKGKGPIEMAEDKRQADSDLDHLMAYLRKPSRKMREQSFRNAAKNVAPELAHYEQQHSNLRADAPYPPLQEPVDRRAEDYPRNLRDQSLRNTATRMALELARYDKEHPNLRANAPDPPPHEVETKLGDRPGPFSTALKIIRGRAEKREFGDVNWKPKERNDDDVRPRKPVPSLLDLCLSVLAKNAESIVSLHGIPYSLRLRLSNLLCDSGGMSKHFLYLLAQGHPTKIQVKDCSWLTEKEFTEWFQALDTSDLMVLQLDQCGRCIADYTILPTIDREPDRLRLLISLSLTRACRLTNDGLKSLVFATPALRSINLSQCSLLTSASIDTIADLLGHVLQELYLDDCPRLNAMLILPSLKKIEHLEVLSVAGIQTVCDVFIKWLLSARGHNMKELVLSNCEELTDLSLKEIANTCTGLRKLDLVNLRKLTDASLEYLANGCQQIQTLKLSRNPFSDEAIAAFLETSGKLLKELSLNNIRKVGVITAWTLSKCGRCLSILDLSWCRKLKDEELGLIVDNCLSLRVLKLFGCTQITRVFIDGHSNPHVQIIGLPLTPTLRIGMPEQQDSILRYSTVE